MNIKEHLRFAFKVAVALFIFNLVLGLLEKYGGFGSGQLRKYVYDPANVLPLPGANSSSTGG